ncbi:MAG: hypothetical protein RL697_102 [Pseudomonadota bacterium]|jgi:hemoglobin/transferrin/lactoferrin receptor protein
MKHQKTLLAAAVTASLNVAIAQQVIDSPEIQTIVVSATRTPNPLDKTAASVSVVTHKDFEEVQAQTVGDVLKKLPGVDFGGGPRTDGQLPTIRGYQGNDIILMVDGARRNANYGLTTPLFIDSYFLGSAEVVRGAASSLYGSGGLGGAMVFNTLSAKDLLVGDKTFGADARLGYQSGDRSKYQNARVYGKQGALDTLVAVGYRDFNDIRQAEGGTLPYNNGHSYSGLVKFGYEVDAKTRVELSHQLYTKEAYEPNNPQVISANLQQTHNSQNETVLKFMREGDNGDKRLDARAYVTQTNNQRDANGSLRYWDSEVKTTGLSIQNTQAYLSSHRLTYGMDAYRDKQVTAGNVGVNPAGELQVMGLFVQDEISVNEKFRIIPSLRYDSYSSTPANSGQASTKNDHFSPKLVASWQLGSAVSVYASHGQSYRAPTIWETYQSLNGTNNLFQFRENTNLRPQVDTTTEIGARYEAKGLIQSNDKLKIDINVFDTDAKDLISSTVIGTYTRTAPFSGTGNISQYQNVTNASRQGGEIGASYYLNGWRFDANYSRVRVNNTDTGANLFSPPDRLSTKIRYVIPSTKVTIGLSSTVVSAQDYDSTVNRRRPAYTTHDFFGAWDLPGKSWRMNFGITNLTDEKYWVYQSSTAASSMPYEMGRSYYVTLSGSF